MSERIFYVGARVAEVSMLHLTRALDIRPLKQCHATIIYSRKWFPYKPARFFPLVIEPPFMFDVFHTVSVLRFQSPRLFERHIELRDAGGTWDYPDFKAHISLGDTGGMPQSDLDIHITFDREYYMTWEQAT